MAKRQTIVIKKVYVVAAGHHGGSWKVALADFMTAMMAFFLVMWLIGQSEDSKKAVSDYFSTPSVIEYNFQNFGAELTLEKLFLDFINDPLRAVQSFVEPSDKTPNILDMGSAKVIASFMADKMTDTAKNVNISQDGFEFDIPDTYLFEKGTATPNKKYIEVMNRLIQITSGLEDSEVKLTSALFTQVVANQSEELAKNVAQDRLDTFSNKIKATFEHSSNEVKGSINVKNKKGEVGAENLMGFMRISIKQKQNTDKPKRKIQSMFGDKDSGKSVYDSFAGQVVNRQEVPKLKKEGFSPNLVNPAEAELKHIEHEGDPGQSENNTDKIQQ